jgi:hypothetical protein
LSGRPDDETQADPFVSIGTWFGPSTVADPPALHELLHALQYTGLSSNRVDMIFLGDGYTASQLDTVYIDLVTSYLNYIFGGAALTDPFTRYQNFFNIYIVDVTSVQEGADHPTDGIYVDTALDASYLWDGVTERLLYISNSKANAILNPVLAGSDIGKERLYCVVNDTQYGGGGLYGMFAGGNLFAHEVALHEIGHSFAHLADEYGGEGAYVGGDPPLINVTTDPTGAKWSDWLAMMIPFSESSAPTKAATTRTLESTGLLSTPRCAR